MPVREVQTCVFFSVINRLIHNRKKPHILCSTNVLLFLKFQLPFFKPVNMQLLTGSSVQDVVFVAGYCRSSNHLYLNIYYSFFLLVSFNTCSLETTGFQVCCPYTVFYSKSPGPSAAVIVEPINERSLTTLTNGNVYIHYTLHVLLQNNCKFSS